MALFRDDWQQPKEQKPASQPGFFRSDYTPTGGQFDTRAQINIPTAPASSPGLLESFGRDLYAPIFNLTKGGTNVRAFQREEEDYRNTIASLEETIAKARQKASDSSTPEAERRRWKALEIKTVQQRDKIANKRLGETSEQIESMDPTRAAASIVELGSYALMPGATRLAGLSRGGQALRTGTLARGATTAAPKLSELGARGLTRAAGVGAAEGAAYGGTGYFARAEDPNASGLLTAMGTGGAFGGAIPVVGAAAGRGIQATKPIIKNLDDAVSKAGGNVLDAALATTPGQKVQAGIMAFRTKIQSSVAPIYKQLDDLQKQGKLTKNAVTKVKSLIQDSRYSSRSMAEDFLKNSDEAQTLFAPVNGKVIGSRAAREETENISRYINARNDLNLLEIDARAGKKVSPSRRKQLQQTVTELETPEMQARFDADVKLNQKMTDLLVDEGIISDAQRKAWRANNEEYIRIQRLLDESEVSQMRPRGAGSSKVSRGSTIAEQKRVGSTKEAANAFDVVQDRAQRVFAEITSNRAANAYIDALEMAGAAGRKLRDADDVIARQSLRESLALSRPLKNAYERFVKSQGKYVRQIQREINQLQKEARGEVEKRVRKAAKQPALVPEGGPNADNIAAVINEMMATDPKIFNRLNKKWATRDKKLAKAITELRDLQTQLSEVNALRREQMKEILERSDEAARGKPTIQRRVNGVKEVYQTTPEIEAAAKGFGANYMGAFGRAISAPVRFMQSTVTGGLNPAWVAISLPRDIIEGMVLSERARATHHPANIIGSIADMLGGKNKELFDRFMAVERGSSSVIDLTRAAKSNAKAARELSRMQLPKVKRAGQVIKSPADFYGALQDSSKWNEYFAKYMNFRGVYNDAIKQGIPEDEAFQLALFNGRQATGNLLETGDWTRALQAVYPYFNPAIQGGATLGRAFRTRPVSTSAKVIMGVQMPAAIATAWNLSDPRRAEIYMDISESERERFNIIVLPGTTKSGGAWQVLKIPKAPGVGSLANPIERTMMAMYGEDPGEFESFAQSIVKAFGSPIDVGSPSAAIGSTIPFQLKVPTQAVINYNFYKGKEIVPDWVKEENPDEPYKQAFDNTSSTYKKIGQALNISPLIVQQMAEDTTGEFGRNATYTSDVALDLMGLGEGGIGGRSPARSIQRGFFGAYGGVEDRNFGEELDDTITSQRSLSREVTQAIKDGDIDKANRLAQEYNRKVEGLLQTAQDRGGEFVNLNDKQKGLLEQLKFPVENGRLTQRSIESRKNQ